MVRRELEILEPKASFVRLFVDVFTKRFLSASPAPGLDWALRVQRPALKQSLCPQISQNECAICFLLEP